MKKFKFKTQESIIKGIEEKPIKKGFNWDRLIYFATLLIVVISFGSYFISKQVEVQAESEIIMDKFNVTFTDDVIVSEYFVEEGDSVAKGDSLFTYRFQFEDDDDDLTIINNSQKKEYSGDTENWLTREKLNAQKNIDLKQMEITSLQREVNCVEGSMEQIKKEVFLEIHPPAKLQKARETVERSKIQLQKAREELTYLRRYLELTLQRLDELRSQVPNLQLGELNGIMAGVGDGGKNEFVYLAPKEGMISQIYARSEEVAYEQNLVLDIIEFQGLLILAYFRQEDLKFVNIGDKVDIKFPDGSDSKGIIDKLYIKTTSLPDRLYDSGSKVERRIRAVVIPLNVEDSAKWYEFYKINVIVSKPKYF